MITAADIPIFDSPLSQIYKDDNFGYNLGDLLNAPYMLGIWPHHHLLKGTMLKKGALLPQSILYYYCQGYIDGEDTPNRERLNHAVQMFIMNKESKQGTVPVEKKDTKFIRMLTKVQRPDVLCVHIRSGDRGCCSEAYKTKIRNLSERFSETILLCGVHYDQQISTHSASIQNMVSDLNSIMQGKPKISVYMAEADMHLSCMREAKHLLLHKTGFSIIGSLVCQGQIYLTDEFERHPNWLAMNIPFTML